VELYAQEAQDPYYNFANGVVGLAFDGIADDFVEMAFDPSIINETLRKDINELMSDIESVDISSIAPFTVSMDNCEAPSRCYYTFIIHKASGKSLAEIQFRFFDEGDYLIDDFNFISNAELNEVRKKSGADSIRF